MTLLPSVIAYAGTSFRITAPAAIIAPCLIVTPDYIVALAPTQTSSSNTMGPLG